MKKNILTFLIVVFGILLFHIVSTLTVARGDIVRVGVIDGPLSRKIAVTNNIVNIKENTANALDLRHKEARKGSYMAATQSGASGVNVAQNSNGVNKKFSLRDSDGIELWFSDRESQQR